MAEKADVIVAALGEGAESSGESASRAFLQVGHGFGKCRAEATVAARNGSYTPHTLHMGGGIGQRAYQSDFTVGRRSPHGDDL